MDESRGKQSKGGVGGIVLELPVRKVNCTGMNGLGANYPGMNGPESELSWNERSVRANCPGMNGPRAKRPGMNGLGANCPGMNGPESDLSWNEWFGERTVLE